MFDPTPNPDLGSDVYKFKPPIFTSNVGLGGSAMSLEKIYKSIDWPFSKPVNPNVTKSLYQSGKSRADLWQFAGLVALERTIERANRACDLEMNKNPFEFKCQISSYYKCISNAFPRSMVKCLAEC